MVCCVSCGEELSSRLVEEKKLIEDVLVKGDVIVKNSYYQSEGTQREVHRFYSFEIPESARGAVFLGSFTADHDVQIFLRDEMGYLKWLARKDEGSISSWVVNWLKEGSANVPLLTGKKYYLVFYFYNSDCRGLLCLGNKQSNAKVAASFTVSYEM